MFILRSATIYLTPIGFLCSAYNLLPLSLCASIIGSIIGYLFLFIVNTLFKYVRNKDGIGDGDYDLLIFIGSFTGVIGCWASITIGSVIGSLYGICFVMYSNYFHEKNLSLNSTKIPFGPFLACGSIVFVFLQRYFFCYLAIG